MPPRERRDSRVPLGWSRGGDTTPGMQGAKEQRHGVLVPQPRVPGEPLGLVAVQQQQW